VTKPQQRLATAKYLCADNRHLVRVILAYNNALDYAQSVYGFAQLYARNARGIT